MPDQSPLGVVKEEPIPAATSTSSPLDVVKEEPILGVTPPPSTPTTTIFGIARPDADRAAAALAALQAKQAALDDPAVVASKLPSALQWAGGFALAAREPLANTVAAIQGVFTGRDLLQAAMAAMRSSPNASTAATVFSMAFKLATKGGLSVTDAVKLGQQAVEMVGAQAAGGASTGGTVRPPPLGTLRPTGPPPAVSAPPPPLGTLRPTGPPAEPAVSAPPPPLGTLRPTGPPAEPAVSAAAPPKVQGPARSPEELARMFAPRAGPGEPTLLYGKYAGQTLESVDTAYLKWYREHPNVPDDLKAAIDHVLRRRAETPNTVQSFVPQ